MHDYMYQQLTASLPRPNFRCVWPLLFACARMVTVIITSRGGTLHRRWNSPRHLPRKVRKSVLGIPPTSQETKMTIC